MNFEWGRIIWQQFGAAIDMLENAMRACPEHLWKDSIWTDPSDDKAYTEFWFVVYHTLYWLDLYLAGSKESFKPPHPFIVGKLPDRAYTRDQVQGYLEYCRQKCRETFETLTEEKAGQICEFSWIGKISYAELQLYSMRHVQEHASQLSLHLGHKVGSAPDWVTRAGSQAA